MQEYIIKLESMSIKFLRNIYGKKEEILYLHVRVFLLYAHKEHLHVSFFLMKKMSCLRKVKCHAMLVCSGYNLIITN